MNIKSTNFAQNNLGTSSRSNQSTSKPIKVDQKSKNKPVRKLKSPNFKNNIKNQQSAEKIISKTKCPPYLKRQNTEQSPQKIIKSQNIRQISQWPDSNTQNKNMHKSRECIKIHSDEQSTNVYQNYKQSADQEQDPYKIAEQKRSKRQKQKSIQPSRDFSISLMCVKQKKKGQMYQTQKTNTQQDIKSCTTSQHLTLRQLKQNLKKNLISFKSLTKHHEKQSQYYSTKVQINKDEQKRLNRIHDVEKNIIKYKIYQLKEQMDERLKRKNLI